MGLMDYVKIIVLVVILFFLYSIASSPGLEGKLFVFAIIIVGGWWYLKKDAKMSINPVNLYYQRLVRLCELKGKGSLRYLVFSGDANNQKYIKGEILGGPVVVRDRTIERIPIAWNETKDQFGNVVKTATDFKNRYKYPPGHAWHFRYTFLYTPSYGILYSIPLVGWLFSSFRNKCLITVWEPQLRSKQMVGDIEIKGVNTRFVEQMEYISDELFDYDFEMLHLSHEVDRITLADMLAMEPTRIRKAIDSNSEHNKSLDLKDINLPVGDVN